jgi:predicted nucleotidyltransferase component of viral defense system
VRAVALEELAAERIAMLGGKPRARDVFDLWFILTHAEQLERGKTRAIAQEIALAKRVELRATLDLAYHPLLQRAWENALKNVRLHPSLEQAEAEIAQALTQIL